MRNWKVNMNQVLLVSVTVALFACSQAFGYISPELRAAVEKNMPTPISYHKLLGERCVYLGKEEYTITKPKRRTYRFHAVRHPGLGKVMVPLDTWHLPYHYTKNWYWLDDVEDFNGAGKWFYIRPNYINPTGVPGERMTIAVDYTNGTELFIKWTSRKRRTSLKRYGNFVFKDWPYAYAVLGINDGGKQFMEIFAAEGVRFGKYLKAVNARIIMADKFAY